MALEHTMRFSLQSDFAIIARTRRLVRRSQALLAASRKAVPARWLSSVEPGPGDHPIDLPLQLKLLDEYEDR